MIPVALVSIITFAPWAFRSWMEFGSPFPGQALTNALSLQGTDIFAWRDQPTLDRYLAAGPATLLELRWTGTVHNLTQVLLFLGVPLSIVGLIGLPSLARWRPSAGAASSTTIDPLRPLLIFSVLTFLVASLVFPVSTTWGTFLHAAGAIHVLLVISALLVLDRVIGWVGARRGWTNPVAWLGPAFAIAGCLLFTFALLVEDGRTSRAYAERYAAITAAFSGVAADGTGVDLAAEPGPVITDFPIWFAEETRHHALALAERVDRLRSSTWPRTFDPPARYVVVDAVNNGIFLTELTAGGPRRRLLRPGRAPGPVGLSPATSTTSWSSGSAACSGGGGAVGSGTIG